MLAEIIASTRERGERYQFAEAFLSAIWRIRNGEETTAITALQKYIQQEKNPYLNSLGVLTKKFLFPESESKKSSSPQRLECKRTLPYFSLCRFFRLEEFLEEVETKNSEITKNYTNLLRVLSPFLEEETSSQIPFLSNLDEDLPGKLAVIGFAKEAGFFQKLLIDSEKLASQALDTSFERQAYFQTIAGDYRLAENTLLTLLKESRNKKTNYLNRIYLKLGVLSYLQKDYEKSLDYYLSLDFRDWSPSTVHPITGDGLSIPEAKDLVSVSVWRAKKSVSALKALREIKVGDKFSEEDIWPKLRIIQIILEENPELASKMTDDIIYLSQSKSWKKSEYIGTLLQGYIQILLKNYRRSTIEFTKARGILPESEKDFESEWIRHAGLVFAHMASGKRPPIDGNANELLGLSKKGDTNDTSLQASHYYPVSFSKEKLTQDLLSFWKEKNQPMKALEYLHIFNKENNPLPEIADYTLLQIPKVKQRLKQFQGFQTGRDTKLSNSVFSEARDYYLSKVAEEAPEFSNKFLGFVKVPFVSLYQTPGEITIFTFDPKNKQLGFDRVYSTSADAFEVRASLKNFAESIQTNELQIYFNKPGVVAYDYLKYQYPDLNLYLFDSYGAHSGNHRDDLVPVVWSRDGVNQLEGKELQVDRLYFEGTKIFREQNKLMVWNFDVDRNYRSSLSEMRWGDDNNKLFFKKVARRIDFRTLPYSVVVTENALGKGVFETRPSILMDFCKFWLALGTEEVVYSKKLGANPFEELRQYLNSPQGSKTNLTTNEGLLVIRTIK